MVILKFASQFITLMVYPANNNNKYSGKNIKFHFIKTYYKSHAVKCAMHQNWYQDDSSQLPETV